MISLNSTVYKLQIQTRLSLKCSAWKGFMKTIFKKNVGSEKKILSEKKIWGSEKFWVRKKFGSKIFLEAIKFVV